MNNSAEYATHCTDDDGTPCISLTGSTLIMSSLPSNNSIGQQVTTPKSIFTHGDMNCLVLTVLCHVDGLSVISIHKASVGGARNSNNASNR